MPTTTRHQGKYGTTPVEIYMIYGEGALKDGWYVDDGIDVVKVNAAVLFSEVDLDDYTDVAELIIERARQRVIDATNAATTFRDFYDLGNVLGQSQQDMQVVESARQRAEARAIESLRNGA